MKIEIDLPDEEYKYLQLITELKKTNLENLVSNLLRDLITIYQENIKTPF